MRKKAPDGLTTIERAILTRLKKGPAALSSLAHAARCKSASIKVHICRLRKKLPAGETIPRGFYGYQTYSLMVRKTEAQRSSHAGCKPETGATSGKTEKPPRPVDQGNSKRNKMLYGSESLPDYTLCELTSRLFRHFRTLARATILRSWYVGCVLFGDSMTPSRTLLHGRGE